ncbi:MAG: ATP-grasp domain-containing protein [Oscillospiraceae bacterium]|nr:ATP-grasp domain-containing protein [Oscillospiraceae bacterium]
MKRKKLLFLGIDTSTVDAIKYAKSKNIYTIVTDFNSPEAKPEKKAADEYWMIDVSDFEALKNRCMEEGITNIFAGNHEFCLDQCKRLCVELGFPFYASEAGWNAARDKGIYKEKCREAGLLTPRKYHLDPDFSEKDLAKIQYPVIVKPSDSYARKGISIVTNQDELSAAYEKALAYSDNKKIIVEEYIDGNDLFIGCYIHNKKLIPLHVTANQFIIVDGQKRFGFGDHFSKYTNLVDKQLLSKYEKLISDLNCENGACMFQCISRNGLIYNIEFSYRLDGIRSWERIERLRGINQLKMMVDLALGESVSDDSFVVNESREMCLGYVIWSLPGKISKIDGKKELYSRDDLIVLVDRFQEGDSVLDVFDMRSIAFIIEVFGMTSEEIREKIIGIHKTLHFYDENMHEMLMHRVPDYENW